MHNGTRFYDKYISTKNRLKYIDDDESGVNTKILVRKWYNARYQNTYSNRHYVLKNDFIKDTRICQTHSGRKPNATGYVLITGSPYSYAEGYPHHRSCLHDAIINAAPRIGEKNDRSELYRQCSPRRVMDTTIKELDKRECVSSIIKIASLLGIERDKMGPLGILQRINDDVYVCICSIYSKIF